MNTSATQTLLSGHESVDAPQLPVTWVHHSTREVPAGDRFEFCRALATGSRLESPLGARDDYFGDFRYALTPAGVDFVEMKADPCASRFGADADDTAIVIGVVNAGYMHIRHGKDQAHELHAGSGPVLFDPGRQMTARTSRIDTSYLRISRVAIVQAVGGDAVPRGMAVRSLPPTLLSAQLQACVRGLRQGGCDGVAAAAALRAARALALVALASTRSAGHHWSDALDDALFDAALHQLGQQVANPRVTVDAVAATLACSRAQLYRVFAARGEGVEERLRWLRMQHAAKLLTAWPRLAFDTIAERCGYGDPVAFHKAFRRHVGMTPRDWRAAHSAASGGII
ncbi:AraC family transcriptional regulator [Pseudolysobacter antarcticus]|uniref:AraC family transcriptional regulator n=1 Tax=Pseudolysobacter antarcticus TaxID=2511995 RepID=A0A411HEX9_9GAMM|nr:helix-turn-helix transcriptional regulator [Pseudolysobacter antarcticus]QBB69043.1 AraC family transcriptional regulator [Pseudolysobacter antarcticus]